MKPLWNRLFYSACFVTIILCWTGVWLQKGRQAKMNRSVEELNQAWRSAHEPRVLILFSLDDCGLCLQEAEYWSKADVLLGDRCELVGITDYDSASLTDFIREYQINFRVIKDSTLYRKVLAVVPHEKSPAKVFVSPGGEILSIEGPMKDRTDQESFLQRVVSVLFHGDRELETQLSADKPFTQY